MKNLTPIRLLTFLIILFCGLLSHFTYAQKQPGIPQPRGPVNLSEPANVVMFIILPALVIIGFFFWRAAVKRRQDDKDK